MEDTLGTLYHIRRFYVFQENGKESYVIVPQSLFQRAVKPYFPECENFFYNAYQEYGILCPHLHSFCDKDFIVTKPIPITKEVLLGYFGRQNVRNMGQRTYMWALETATKTNQHNRIARQKKETDDFWGS